MGTRTRVCVHTDRLPIQIFTLHSKHHTWTGEKLSEMQTQVWQINTTNQRYYKYTHKGATDLNDRALVMVSEELIIPNNPESRMTKHLPWVRGVGVTVNYRLRWRSQCKTHTPLQQSRGNSDTHKPEWSSNTLHFYLFRWNVYSKLACHDNKRL